MNSTVTTPPVTRFAAAQASTVTAIVHDDEGERDMATTTFERPTVQTREGGAELKPGRYGPNSYRTTARVVGVVYLAGFVVGIGGNTVFLFEGLRVATGAV